MIEAHPDITGVSVVGVAAFPRIIGALAARVDLDAPESRIGDGTSLVSYADPSAENDPLVRLEVDQVRDELAARLAATSQAAEAAARTVLARWEAAADPDASFFADILTHEETRLVGAWANRHYQAYRIAEMTDAGIEVRPGSSCGVEQLLAELVGPSPDDPSQVPMSQVTAVFAFLAATFAAASRGVAELLRAHPGH